MLDVQGRIIESRLYLPEFSLPTVVPPLMQQTTSPGISASSSKRDYGWCSCRFGHRAEEE